MNIHYNVEGPGALTTYIQPVNQGSAADEFCNLPLSVWPQQDSNRTRPFFFQWEESIVNPFLVKEELTWILSHIATSRIKQACLLKITNPNSKLDISIQENIKRMFLNRALSKNVERAPEHAAFHLERIETAVKELEDTVLFIPIDNYIKKIPSEVLLHILHMAYPVHTPADPANLAEYLRARHIFSRFSLVCRWWENLVPSILYQSLLLIAKPKLACKLQKALSSHGRIVGKITIDDGGAEDNELHITSCQRYFDGIISLCPKLRSLCLCGDYRPFHRNPGALGISFPKLTIPPIKELEVFLSRYVEVNLNDYIQPFAHSVDSLTIRGWGASNQPLSSSPVAIPNLQRLVVDGGEINRIGINNIFVAKSGSKKPTTLTHLAISNSTLITPEDILCILKDNELGKGLYSLKLATYNHCPDHSYPNELFSLCPNLVEFSFNTTCPITIFDYLPSTLRSLQLAIFWSLSPSISEEGVLHSYEQFLPYLNSNRSLSLRQLSIIRQPYMGQKDMSTKKMLRLGLHQGSDCRQKLASVCYQRGIDLRYSVSINICTTAQR